MNEIALLSRITDADAGAVLDQAGHAEITDLVTSLPVRASGPRSRAQGRTLGLPTWAAVSGLAGLAATVLAVLVVLEATTSTPPAFALTQNPNGSVTVTLNNVAHGVPALNAEFIRLGVSFRAIPVIAGCTAKDQLPLIPAETGTLSTRLTIPEGTKNIPAGYFGFVAAKQITPGRVVLSTGTMPEPLPHCIPDRVAGRISGPPSSRTTG